MLHYLQRNKNITAYSNFKTPTRAEYFFELKEESDVDKVHEIYHFAETKGMKVLVIGWGTNMLFAFDIFEWIVIKNSLDWWTYDTESKLLTSYSNEAIREIAKKLEDDYGQNLWHRFIWLPWSMGWAVFWNAGCFWLETENNFVEAHLVDVTTWEKKVYEKKDMNFSYRNSILKEEEWKWFLIKAVFDLSKKIEKYHSDIDNIDFRENKQPNGNSCGSFFKNPNREQSAWYLIEQVWLKWHSIWGAYFSQKHANFLMHDGTWKWQDLVELLELAQAKVKDKFWVELVNEVRIIRN
jgi:UDP-N-acetylmuramate dehydrogenase